MYVPKEYISSAERKNKVRLRKLLNIFWRGILKSGQKCLIEKNSQVDGMII